jgi:acylphosphatase
VAVDRADDPVTDQQRLTARVLGHVQGVGFRWWVRSRADDLGLTGWVMNDDDERGLLLVAEGLPDDLDELEQLLWHGPSAARVDDVQARRDPASGEFHRFQINRQ